MSENQANKTEEMLAVENGEQEIKKPAVRPKRKWTKESWRNIGKIALVFLLILVSATIVYLVFYFLGWTGDDGMMRLEEDISAAGTLAPLIFIGVQVFYTVILFVIPGQTLAFIALGLVLFNPWQALLYVTIGMMFSSTINFTIGKFLGEKVVRKIVGSKTLDEYIPYLQRKADVYYPLFMLLPIFPDDEICMIVGMTGMKYRYFIPVTFLTRTVGIAASVFVGDIVPWTTLGVRGYIALGIDFLIFFVIMFAFGRAIELFLRKKEAKEYAASEILKEKTLE